MGRGKLNIANLFNNFVTVHGLLEYWIVEAEEKVRSKN